VHHVLISLVFHGSAQQGESLLWQGWLEKHPETVTAPWDDVDTRAAWDQHAAEASYYYWEQYVYWAAQGWTLGSGPRDGDEGQEEGVTGEPEVGRNVPKDNGSAGEATAAHPGTSDHESCGTEEEENRGIGLEELIVEMSLHTAEGETGGPGDDGSFGSHEEPCDGGNDRKRAASSSTAGENTGKE